MRKSLNPLKKKYKKVPKQQKKLKPSPPATETDDQLQFTEEEIKEKVKNLFYILTIS